jgi:cytochrome c peroxidase
MFSRELFWDGRARSLEEQAVEPLFSPSEMGMQTREALVARVSAIPEYRRQFARVFGARGLTVEAVAKAIAAFERTQLSGNAPFDRFMAGDAGAVTDAQRRGWELFRGKARCIECHTFDASSPFFTDFRFHNTGVATKNVDFDELMRRAAAGRRLPDPSQRAPGVSELGRFLTTGRPEDVGAFKTPTLRDVELTTPYMHDGSEKTLLDVVRFYNRGGERNRALDSRMRPLRLSDAEMNELVEFMRALTSDDVLRQSQSTQPQTRAPFTPGAGEQSRR